MSTPINPGVTWGRPRQPSGGKGKWHLLLESRRNVSGSEFGGRTGGRVPAGGLFAIALCGQALNDPGWEEQPVLYPHLWYGLTQPFPVPGTAWCLPCAEAAIRQAGSVPA